jgi:nitric oxide reductase subunit B
MGVYGMLAVGLALFCLRYLIPDDKWSDKAVKFSFWALNIGLFWMCMVTLLPLGIIQLYHAVNTGYFEARSLDFLTTACCAIIKGNRTNKLKSC